MRFLHVIVFSLHLIPWCSLSVHASEIMVSAAASLTNVLQEIGPAYEAASGNTLHFNFGSSGALARQIREGAPADVFFSADQLRANQLEEAGLLLNDTRRTLLANTLVLIVNQDDPAPVKTFTDLTHPEVRRIAIGEPQTVPAGTYAQKWLRQKELWTATRDKTVPLANVRAVLAAVESGNTDVGLVYKTDALISKKVTVVAEVPLSDGLDITYPAAVLKSSSEPETAKAFIDYLTSPEATEIFARHGFLKPAP